MEQLKQNEIIKSISFDETEILNNILSLYLPSREIDLDPTYSKGNVYKGLNISIKLKFDLNPLSEDVKQSDCRSLPVQDDTVLSIFYDPPFLCSAPPKPSDKGIMRSRFGTYKNIEELWSFYDDSLREFYRIMKNSGVLIVKSQDTVDCRKQYLSHVFLINKATQIGFYCKDLFVYLAKNRITDKRKQQHARKFHSYYLVFLKNKTVIKYF